MTNMIRCPAGQHVYDGDRYMVCPYCGTRRSPPEKEAQPAQASRLDEAKAIQAGAAKPAAGAKTVYQGATKKGVRLVHGWLVVTAGPGKGSSFALYAGSNSIGRDDGQDVRLSFKGEEDGQISRVDHALILVDPKTLHTAVQHKEGKNLTYVNGDAMFEPSRQLKSYDTVTLGDTTLVYVPFCGEGFRWPAVVTE